MVDTHHSTHFLPDALRAIRKLKLDSIEGADWREVESVLVRVNSLSRSARKVVKFSSNQPVEGETSRYVHSDGSSIVDVESTKSIVKYTDCRLPQAVLFIHNSLGEPITVHDVVKEVCVSRRWLEYAFRSAFGISPSKYLRIVRLEVARYRLVSDLSIKCYQVAESVGFNCPRQFSKSFRQHFGYSPSDCRRHMDDSRDDTVQFA